MLNAGCVTLRPGKRARPIVLRGNVGDCLEITFTNLLCPSPRLFSLPTDNPPPTAYEQPVTREAGVHVAGLELVGSINSDASYVGLNLNSLTPPAAAPCAPGESKIYRYFARREGTFLLPFFTRGRRRHRVGRRPDHRRTVRLGDCRTGRGGVVPAQPGHTEGPGARVQAQ